MNNKLYFITLIVLILLVLPSNVNSQNNVNLEIVLPDSYKKVVRGNDIWFTINLLNLGSDSRLDVTLQYDLINRNYEILSTSSKTVAIETQASFVGNVNVPKTLKQGEYYIQVTLFSPTGEAKTKVPVFIKEREDINPLYYLVAFVIVLGLLTAIIVFSKPIIGKIELRSKIHKIVKNKFKRK